MPVILPPETYREWLDPDADAAGLLGLLQPSEWPDMAHHEVFKEVNRAANDYPALVERPASEMQFDLTGGLGS